MPEQQRNRSPWDRWSNCHLSVGIGVMPAIVDCRSDAADIAKTLNPGMSPAQFYGVVLPNIINNPQDWGCPRSYSSRPNWDAETIGPMIADAIWGKPFHPASPAARQWSRLPFKLLKRLCGGRSPRNVLPNSWEVTERECAQILDAANENRKYGGNDWQHWLEHPLAFICRYASGIIGNYVPRTRAIADWLAAKKDWAGWSRPMEVGYGANGQMRTVNPADLLDEIQDNDLTQKSKTAPEKVFRSVLRRTDTETLAKLANSHTPFPPLPWTLIPGVVYLDTAAKLADEGRRMNHCVAGYYERCQCGECFILRLPNSTVEVLSGGSVYQHRGKSNADPSEADKKLLNSWFSQRERK